MTPFGCGRAGGGGARIDSFFASRSTDSPRRHTSGIARMIIMCRVDYGEPAQCAQIYSRVRMRSIDGSLTNHDTITSAHL